MNFFKVRGALIIGFCIALVGIASNILNLPGSGDKSLGARYSFVAISVLFLCMFFIYFKSYKKSKESVSVSQWLFAAFWPLGLLALQFIALLRTALTKGILSSEAIFFILTLQVFVGIYWLAAQYFYTLKRPGDYWRYLAWSVVVLALASIALKIIGLTGNNPTGDVDNIHHAEILGYFGFSAYRSSMPLFSGFNIAGVIFGAAACCLAIFSFMAGKLREIPFFLCAFVAVIVGLLWIDTRGALLAMIVSLFFVLPRKIILAGLFALALGVIALLSSVDAQIVIDSLARPGVDLSSSRVVIWGAAISDLLEPKFVHLIGYGAWGQYVSGVSGEFFELFSEDSYETASLHNSLLQIIFDSGYIGGMFFTISWYCLIRNFWRQHGRDASGATALKLALAIYVFTSGLFEAFCGYSNPASMFLYVGVLTGFFTDLAYQKTTALQNNKFINRI